MCVFGLEKKEVRKWWDMAIFYLSPSEFNPLKIERKWGRRERANGITHLPLVLPPPPTIFFTLIYFFSFFLFPFKLQVLLYSFYLNFSFFFFFPNKIYIIFKIIYQGHESKFMQFTFFYHIFFSFQLDKKVFYHSIFFHPFNETT